MPTPPAPSYQVHQYRITLLELATGAITIQVIQATSPAVASIRLYHIVQEFASAHAAQDGYVRRISIGNHYADIGLNRDQDTFPFVYTPEYACTLTRIDD